ncbi:hypothetical protein IMG5_143150 [Ichthyophthirius multifiliis]|uniref:Uncharacterized protein n=1 Tax=Ichthyophthirius multifiliis TaxID=5932 RepID=G0QXI5_ICHMU|nr:hypothetical protein IMG5_143150 [Ichthyophthirius multifiliis]EGR30067.1 hypothetical protein IMG5_143150 [Ichthyophthirius multifiliis]|eukprot:XP_004031303.1 hypothetical protein IMG5_143150 [Ichthyophthirius multifiliis]
MNEQYNEVVEKNGFLTMSDNKNNTDNNNQNNNNDNNDEFIAIPCRTYDISITYDEYYHTPRMWLSGTNEDGKPLNTQQILEDIMSEYQGETVTPEEHPHLGLKQVTIHPCKHSQVLKAFIEKAKENKVNLKPNQCLLIFLKFMSSVMPTIEYDATTDLLFDQI